MAEPEYDITEPAGHRDSTDEIIRQFLLAPRRRTGFDPFFRFTAACTISYLRRLGRHGWRLPVDDRTDRDPVADLALDLLGEILQSKPGRPFHRVFEYFRAAGITPADLADQSGLTDLYLIFLRRQIRQQLSRLRKQVDSQIENLKRRIRETLEATKNQRHSETIPSDSTERSDIPDELLHRLAEETYLESTSRSDWCLRLAAHLEQEEQYRSNVPISRLQAVMVRVNAAYADLDGSLLHGQYNSSALALQGAAEKARCATIEFVGRDIIPAFADKGRLTSEDAAGLLSICNLYLADWAACGETDRIPKYFREQMPPDRQERYLKDYKYILDTIIARARERFVALMRKDPTVQSLRGYW